MNYRTNRGVVLLPILGALALAVCACANSSDGSALSSVTSPSATTVTETFSSSIGQNGTATHPFTVKSSGYNLLAGFTSISPASVSALGLGVGTWDATTSTCGLNQSQNDVAKSGSTAISGTAGAGNFCVRVYDAGNIPAGVTADYTLQIQHY